MGFESATDLWFGWIFSRRKRQPRTVVRGFSKCLSTAQLIHLGVGATLGAGTYVVTGQVAANIAGPAVVISFTIAAITSILSGLCYAEFGSRVPQTTGSAYTYSYVTVGEVWAFTIGWNLILEYMIGTAADAAALSGSFDYIVGYRVKTWIVENIGTFSSPYLGDYPDILSCIFTIAVTIVLAFGVRESAWFTVTFNIFNTIVVVFIIVVGAIYAEPKNWTEGDGFFPYGASGVISGAATCFYAFVGFDIIATTGEEARDPSKSIPVAIVASLVIVFVAYFGVSTVVTLMIPYDKLDKLAPIPNAFKQRGLDWANYIIAIGAICGLSSSLLGNLFPLPRIIYAMSHDGLLFKMFQNISEKTEVPVNATIYPGILTAIFSLLFNLEELVEMMSIGTLLAYTLVSLCILILRYQPDEYSSSHEHEPLIQEDFDSICSLDSSNEVIQIENVEWTHEGMAIDKKQKEQRRQLHLLRHQRKEQQRRGVTGVNMGDAETDIDSAAAVAEDGMDLQIKESEVVEHSVQGNAATIGEHSKTDNNGEETPMNNDRQTDSTADGSAAKTIATSRRQYGATDNMDAEGIEANKDNDDDDVPATSGGGENGEPPWTRSSRSGPDPTLYTGRVVTCNCLLLFVWFFGFNSTILFAFDQLLDKHPLAIFSCCFFGLLILISVGIIYSMPQNKKQFGFMAPCVPALPIVAIYANTFLMLKLSNLTWIRFGLWMAIGGAIYVFYGIRNSKAKKTN